MIKRRQDAKPHEGLGQIAVRTVKTDKRSKGVCKQGNCSEKLEARVGIEPTHKGFADLSLTTWVPRLLPAALKSEGAGEQLSL